MKIKQLIISEINKNGKINVNRFIDLCLHSVEGYYRKINPIGIQNDFITAPEISQMFGEILGSFIINYWDRKIGTKFNLIELGPGKGTLINDILRVSNKHKKFQDLMHLTLIEKNKALIKFQKSSINKKTIKKITWKDNFQITNNLPSIIYSNEFFDCFPIRQFYRKEKWLEKFIQYDISNNLFSFTSQNIEDEYLVEQLKKFDHIKLAEISTSRKEYFHNICKFIKKNKGIIITIDYGYIDPPNIYSLQTLCNHKKTHLFENLGSQDITAFVNFDELIDIAKKNLLDIDIFCSQKEFLISCGIKERKNKLKTNQNQNNIESEFIRLTDKNQMGSNFKVLVVSCM